MHLSTKWLTILLCAVGTLGPAFSLPAQATGEKDKPKVPSNKLVLTPRAAPEPVLKYTFLPTLVEQKPGNAAVHYGKVKAEQNFFFGSNDLWQHIEAVSSCELSALKDDHTHDQLLNLGPIYSNMRAGALCRHVDWQLPLRDVFFTGILLPEVQESRTFVRLLYCRARIQIARGDFDGAAETIQTGMALGQHIAQGETLINGLIGLVAMQSMLAAIQEFIAQPGAPNLYWALADLPTPMFDLRPGLEGERAALYLTETGWLHPEKLQGDEHFWRRELDRLWKHLRSVDDRSTADMLTMYVVRGYPAAKQRLVARGFEATDVEAMPVPKVIMLDALHEYNCQRDLALAKLRQALVDPTRLADVRNETTRPTSQSLPLWETMGLGTLHSVATSVQRVERLRAALQVVEALRLNAAESGKLPNRLSEITSVYLPVDPTTAQPFTYELAGDKATITSATQPELKLELRLRP